MYELSAFIIYFSIIFLIGFLFSSKKLSSNDFILGNRSLNYWVTALAAHASEMSGWLFMAFPSMILLYGLSKVWIALGLVICMFLNWHFVATKIRIATEKLDSLTFFSYLGKRFQDESGLLRIVSVLLCSFFYILYISVGLMSLGMVMSSLFPISYEMAAFLSILIALPYVLIGGYKTLAWIDLFQGLFLMATIVFVPLFLFNEAGGWVGIKLAASLQEKPLSVFQNFSFSSIFKSILIMLGWGLGYFGQPTILTKFMGIQKSEEIVKSKLVGMSWMSISLSAAIGVGLIGIALLPTDFPNPEMIFIELVKNSFHPFVAGLMLCAIVAACMNVMSSQVLVLCSTFTEDIYKNSFKPNASSKELLFISRLGTLCIALIAFIIAYFRLDTIYSLVLYAWSGLGASFGPILLFSLYSKKNHVAIAWSGILSGALSSALWPLVEKRLNLGIDPIIAGFVLSFISIWVATLLTKKETEEVLS